MGMPSSYHVAYNLLLVSNCSLMKCELLDSPIGSEQTTHCSWPISSPPNCLFSRLPVWLFLRALAPGYTLRLEHSAFSPPLHQFLCLLQVPALKSLPLRKHPVQTFTQNGAVAPAAPAATYLSPEPTGEGAWPRWEGLGGSCCITARQVQAPELGCESQPALPALFIRWKDE